MDLSERVLEFWFGTGPETYREIWFQSSPEFDREIEEKFGEDRSIAAAGRHDGMAETPDGALALVILLDQFSRNLLRGSPEAFASDPKALMTAKSAIERGFDQQMSLLRRVFFYVPFEHCEDLAVQEQGVELYRALGDADFLKYMIEHRDIIAKFGRFPHRNAVLGRESTAEEVVFLKTFDSF